MMSVSAAGSAQNAQQAVAMLRQTVQAEQVAGSAMVEAATQAGKDAAAQNAVPDNGPRTEGIGERVDVRA